MEIKEIHYRMLQEESRRLGGDLFGVADLRQTQLATYDLDKDLLGQLPFGVAIGVRLADAVLEPDIALSTPLPAGQLSPGSDRP
jgi:hypothetical protein